MQNHNQKLRPPLPFSAFFSVTFSSLGQNTPYHNLNKGVFILSHSFSGLSPWLAITKEETAWWEGLGKGKLLTLQLPISRVRRAEPDRKIHPSRSHLQWHTSNQASLPNSKSAMNPLMSVSSRYPITFQTHEALGGPFRSEPQQHSFYSQKLSLTFSVLHCPSGIRTSLKALSSTWKQLKSSKLRTIQSLTFQSS